MEQIQEKIAVTTLSRRVRLVIDEPNETYYIESALLAEPGDFRTVEQTARRLGFEILDESECPAENYFGGFRVWLARIDGEP